MIPECRPTIFLHHGLEREDVWWRDVWVNENGVSGEAETGGNFLLGSIAMDTHGLEGIRGLVYGRQNSREMEEAYEEMEKALGASRCKVAFEHLWLYSLLYAILFKQLHAYVVTV